MPCHNLPCNDQYNKTKKEITSPRKNFKLRNNKTGESKHTNDEEKTKSSDEESEVKDLIRNLKYRSIEPGKKRSRQSQEKTRSDKKVQEKKEDEIIFERDVVIKKEGNVNSEIERIQASGNSGKIN